MIDLHTHTTASDGRLSPAELVARAATAGIRVLSVTDHDTTASCAPAASACSLAGIEFVPGIEITSIADGTDLHVLGYFIDTVSPTLETLLARQRRLRMERVREIVDKLAAHGIVLDADAILRPGVDDPTRAAGRPWVARALVASGHARDSNDAFSRWLARGRPAFVPRSGPTPEEVFYVVHEAGGIASMAHPVLVKRDEWISGFARAGLDALEAYHSDHDAATTLHYLQMADRLGLAVSGGSDFHADESHGAANPGSVALPPEAFAELKERHRKRRAR